MNQGWRNTFFPSSEWVLQYEEKGPLASLVSVLEIILSKTTFPEKKSCVTFLHRIQCHIHLLWWTKIQHEKVTIVNTACLSQEKLLFIKLLKGQKPVTLEVLSVEQKPSSLTLQSNMSREMISWLPKRLLFLNHSKRSLSLVGKDYIIIDDSNIFLMFIYNLFAKYFYNFRLWFMG